MPDGPTVPEDAKRDKRACFRAGFETSVISAAMVKDAFILLLQVSHDSPRIIFMFSALLEAFV